MIVDATLQASLQLALHLSYWAQSDACLLCRLHMPSIFWQRKDKFMEMCPLTTYVIKTAQLLC